MIIGKNIETLLSALRDAFNRLVNGKQVVGYQSLDISGGTVKTLTVPSGATEAIITLDSKQNITLSAAVMGARYTLHGIDPVCNNATVANNTGNPIFEYQTINVKGEDALTGFKVICTTEGGTNKVALKVIYYK